MFFNIERLTFSRSGFILKRRVFLFAATML